MQGTARFLAMSVAISLFSSCGDDEVDEADRFEDGVCDADEPAAFVKAVSERWYLYPEQLPDVPVPDGAAGPYLDQLVANVDLAPDSEEVAAADRFSYVTTVERFETSSTGDFVGLGIVYRIEGEPDARFLRLTDVFGSGPLEDPTPASEAGLQRGDKILSVNGSDVAALITSRPPEASEFAALADAFGPSTEGEEVRLVIEPPEGETFEARVVRQPIRQNEVSHGEILAVGDLQVGYLVFRAFTPSSADEIARAMAAFEQAAVSRVIVDLRYNGGGLIDVAWYFANLLAGPSHHGEAFVQVVFNSGRAENDFTRSFERAPSCPVEACEVEARPLSNLEEVVFITTGQTASASEVLINGLRSVVPVRIVGNPSFGKPVGFLPFEHTDCDQVFAPVTFKTTNANGEGDFFAGLEVDCLAEDDATRRLGDIEEASLAAAVAVMGSNTCPARSSLTRVLGAKPEPQNYRDLLIRRALQ